MLKNENYISSFIIAAWKSKNVRIMYNAIRLKFSFAEIVIFVSNAGFTAFQLIRFLLLDQPTLIQ